MSLRKKTFTLIEMLIVVVIIGILAAALIPRLQGVQGRARDVQRKTGLSQIGQGMGVARQDSKSFSGLIVGGVAASSALVPDYLASIPSDPNSTRPALNFDFGAVSAGQYGATWSDTTNILILGAFTEIKGSSNGDAVAITGWHLLTMSAASSLIKAGGATGNDGTTGLRYYYAQ